MQACVNWPLGLIISDNNDDDDDDDNNNNNNNNNNDNNNSSSSSNNNDKKIIICWLIGWLKVGLLYCWKIKAKVILQVSIDL